MKENSMWGSLRAALTVRERSINKKRITEQSPSNALTQMADLDEVPLAQKCR